MKVVCIEAFDDNITVGKEYNAFIHSELPHIYFIVDDRGLETGYNKVYFKRIKKKK